MRRTVMSRLALGALALMTTASLAPASASANPSAVHPSAANPTAAAAAASEVCIGSLWGVDPAGSRLTEYQYLAWGSDRFHRRLTMATRLPFRIAHLTVASEWSTDTADHTIFFVVDGDGHLRRVHYRLDYTADDGPRGGIVSQQIVRSGFQGTKALAASAQPASDTKGTTDRRVYVVNRYGELVRWTVPGRTGMARDRRIITTGYGRTLELEGIGNIVVNGVTYDSFMARNTAGHLRSLRVSQSGTRFSNTILIGGGWGTSTTSISATACRRGIDGPKGADGIILAHRQSTGQITAWYDAQLLDRSGSLTKRGVVSSGWWGRTFGA